MTPTPPKGGKNTKATEAINAVAAQVAGITDTNHDGIPDKDQLSKEELAAQYQAAVGLLYSVPELQDIIQEAIEGSWGETPAGIARFKAKIQNSNWYVKNDQYFRQAWAAENYGNVNGQPSGDWQAKMQTARMAVQQRATELGSELSPQQSDALARRYIYEGWGQDGRQNLMDQALASDITYVGSGPSKTLTGQSGNIADAIKAAAHANGLSYDDAYFQSAARSVASGMSTQDDWLRDVRNTAAGLWPSYSDRIKAGEDAATIASPYMSIMAQELGVDKAQISLNDPAIKAALTRVDEKGNPAPLGLYDFQTSLRNDDRWMGSKTATDNISNAALSVAKQWGLVG